jgi:type IX secretion system PorP/SprF family membrane protein
MKKIALKTGLLIFAINVFYILSINAQDIHFSQCRDTPMLINPAQTALNKDVRVILNYKDQWRSFVSPYKTFAFSGEMKLKNKKKKESYIGLGLQIYSDKAGDSKMGTTMGSLNLNGVIKLNDKSKLGLGIMGGLGQHTIDYSDLRWENQYVGTSYSPSAATGEQEGTTSFSYPDAGAGIAWNYGKDQMYISANNGVHATIGISAFHFGLPKYSFYGQTNEKLNTKFIVHGNVDFGVKNSNLIIAPELFYTKQGALQELEIGSVFKYILSEESKYTNFKKNSAISIGVNYRIGDAFIPCVMYEFSNYAVGISYDVNFSKLSRASFSRGGFEVSIRFVTPNPFGSKSKVSFS